MAAELALQMEHLAQVPAELVAATRDAISSAKAPSTRRAYRAAWRGFEAWCAGVALCSLPSAPQALALYVSELARRGRKIATIEKVVVAISQAHEMAGLPSPRRTAIVREALKGWRKRLGVAPSPKAPLVIALLTRALGQFPRDRRGLLHRALLLVGFAGAFRRSELVALDVEDLEFSSDGVKVLLRRSKTDQEGAGRKVALPCGANEETCPVRALGAWLADAGITSGAVFRTVGRGGGVAARRICQQTVVRVVKRAGALAGLDARLVAGHSLRAGFCTSAAAAGKTEFAIMRQTGHRSPAMVHRYVREANLFIDHPGEGIGL